MGSTRPMPMKATTHAKATAHTARGWSRRRFWWCWFMVGSGEEVVEDGEGLGERGAGVAVEAVDAVLQDRRAGLAHGGELLPAGVGEGDARDPAVQHVRRARHEPVALEAAD